MAGSSWHNSGLTFHDPTRFVDQEETSTLDVIGRDPMSSIEWTNEKHSLYISSMEESFVQQLYNSKDSSGWHPQTKHGLDSKSRGQGNLRASGQTKHSRRPEHSRVRGKAVVASSSIQDNNLYMHQSSYAGESPYFSGSGVISRQFAEVSDQNFVEGGYGPDRPER